MTVDFRDPRAAQQMQQPALAPQYRLILGVLAISAVLMCAGALWFWLQPPAWLDAQTAPFLALALGLTGVADLGAVAFLRWFWARQQR
ncbi:MAG TPA: hypothetical protein PKN26_08035 [Giesbergeria sp.]|jgi:hypothetical protein|nr:hypothetical protein [Giesbergeria sp.]HNI77122.1 hypothetical protein [Giesbergeria sp.]HNK06806.1 hypothetical protein [Giesbergeria sp.]HNM40994.1 hypothetical protein [Giesbergeria sp.]HNN17183.1 hypothetical protein [Giesbergeria sp.]